MTAVAVVQQQMRSAERSRYVFPVKGYHDVVSYHWGTHHGGSDLFGTRGTEIRVMHAGRVVEAGHNPRGGNYVYIIGDDKLHYYLAHGNEAPALRVDTWVRAGTRIFGMGDSGNAQGTGVHLHIGIGFGIIDGPGAAGGMGKDYEGTHLLRRVLAATPRPGASPATRRAREHAPRRGASPEDAEERQGRWRAFREDQCGREGPEWPVDVSEEERRRLAALAAEY
jgi:murein DD-endopeptidase MepM/ murein hydrolase activator NlpD